MRSLRCLLPSLVAMLATLNACSDYEHRERPPWRGAAEQACLAKGLVHESATIRAAPPLDGPGICGVSHPFKVTALADGSVALNSTQTLDCPMIAALDGWLRDVVEPAAQARFGEPVVRINSMGSYSCRGINNMSGASLSEHAFANAIDIGGFVLASGRELNVMRGFNGADEQERAFFHEVHAGACGTFTTVLGPGYNVFHYNHIHVDLAMHGMTSRGPRRYCKPVPQPTLPAPPVKDDLPDPPPIEEEMDIARAPLPAPALRSGPPALVASVPPAPVLPTTPRVASAPLPTLSTPAPVRIAARPEPPRSAVRSDPAEAPEAGGDAPLISFAEPEPAPPAPTRRLPPARLSPAHPILATAPDPVDGADAPRDMQPPAPIAPRRRAAPATTEGVPRDWDVTSSIAR